MLQREWEREGGVGCMSGGRAATVNRRKENCRRRCHGRRRMVRLGLGEGDDSRVYFLTLENWA